MTLSQNQTWVYGMDAVASHCATHRYSLGTDIDMNKYGCGRPTEKTDHTQEEHGKNIILIYEYYLK